MSPANLTESLVHALADLPPETRQTVLDRFMAELVKRDAQLAKMQQAAKMKAAGVPYATICNTLKISRRKLVAISSPRGNARAIR